jgi:transcriptional regulator with XRE-family HTH domain
MGGDRTCPDDCPIANWWSLLPEERKDKNKRKAKAMELYPKYTMEQIATQLGVSHPTIVRDLREFVHDEQTQPRTSARGRKGEGRPKGSKQTKPPAPVKGADAVVALADQGLSDKEIAKQTGVSPRQVRRAREDEALVRKGRADPEIDRSELSMTAQEKLDAAIRQYKKNLDRQFTETVRQEVVRRIDEVMLPHWKKQVHDAKTLYDKRRGLMKKETFNTIRRALHPDSRNSISDQKLGEAFDAFMALEKYILDEKDSPTSWPPLPKTWREWEEAKRKGTTTRPSRYANSRSTLRPQ